MTFCTKELYFVIENLQYGKKHVLHRKSLIKAL